MSKNLAEKLGQGITPKQFIDGMEKNKEAFLNWYESFTWDSEETRAFFTGLTSRDDLRCLILMADWCGDVVRNVPVLFRVLDETGIPTEVLVMEQHLETMDQFLTMGGRAIPIAIFTNAEGEVLAQWGPRPAHVQAVMIAFKQENPDRNAPDYNDKIQVARSEMLAKYGETNAQHVITEELRGVLSAL
ncbi:thioredoxin family protein [Brevibacillus dissolubilis]|uniref:thioredoxin family protein n=1 Tax=Brevibacillus dissolubilis TaxID=1844116 RepID=UPI001115E682|nr:thioredoxin family protein [Brevibacillus dissolubilis]